MNCVMKETTKDKRRGIRWDTYHRPRRLIDDADDVGLHAGKHALMQTCRKRPKGSTKHQYK